MTGPARHRHILFMRTKLPLLHSLVAATVLSLAFPTFAGGFAKQKLNPHFWAEGAHYADFDHDGAMDVVIGPYWYAGPEFNRRQEYYPATEKFELRAKDGGKIVIPGFAGELSGRNAYSSNFLTYTHDFNGDNWADILVFGFPGKVTTWYENPRNQAKGHWKAHVVWNETNNESPQLGDITGDGRPELIAHARGKLGYVELNWEDPTQLGEFRAVSPPNPKRFMRFTHGIGYGDVDGDGLKDLVERDGWWRQPKNWDKQSLWKFHPVPFAPKGARGGAQMLVHDFNGDGLNDVATSHDGHGYGLSCYLQFREGDAVRFRDHRILGSKPEDHPQGVSFSQLHALDLADINQDGHMDIVTGKRFWAHGPSGDAEPNAPAVLYWFETRLKDGKLDFVAHQIDDDSGIGTQVTAGDLNGDDMPDIVVGNKKGAFVFINQLKK